jgi:hypothetical protein
MRHRSLLVALLVALATLIGAGATSANDGGEDGHGNKNLVFVQTNQPDGNQIVVYNRDRDGQLTPAGTYSTEATAAPLRLERNRTGWRLRARSCTTGSTSC